MNQHHRPFVAVLLAVASAMTAHAPAIAAPAAPWDDEPAGKEFVHTVSGGQSRIVEVFFPRDHATAAAENDARAKVPGMLMFHGGGWGSGTPAQFRRVCRYFADRGIVAATAEYRMLSKDERPTDGTSFKRVCVTDARAAIHWMKANAGSLGIDPTRLIVGGGSAGGHIALLATTSSSGTATGGDTSAAALVMFNPALDPRDADDPEIDALRHVKADLPPMIVFFGSRDDQWLPGWKRFAAKLETLGNTTTESWVAEGQPHGFFNRPPWQGATIAAADRFLVGLGLLPAAGAPSPDADGAILIREP